MEKNLGKCENNWLKKNSSKIRENAKISNYFNIWKNGDKNKYEIIIWVDI